MIYLVCPHCNAGLRVSPGEPGETESLLEVDQGTLCPKSYPCFRCGRRSSTLFVPGEAPHSLRDVEMFDVTPKEAFAAINGLGLPSEQDCSASAVEKLFAEEKVSGVATRMIRNSHRCIVDYIEFENGTKMYLGSSSLGATVYRIAPKHSYVEEVEGEPADHPSVEEAAATGR